MNNFQKLKIILIFCCLLFKAGLTPVFGAEIFFVPDIKDETKEVRLETEFQIGVFLNTKEKNINAIEGVLQFPSNLLELKEIKDGNSIINFWIQRPALNREGEISFAGITPGGFISEEGFLFSVTFLTKEEGIGQIKMGDIKALLNDGQGTATDVSIYPLNVSIAGDAPLIPIKEIKDIEPPESFLPEIARDPALFENQWFLVFSTQDKKSGIERYEVKETRQRAFAFLSRWIPAESPYQLQDQELRSYVFIRVFDNEGNKRVVEVKPKNQLPSDENYLIFAILITAITISAIIIFIVKFLLKKRIKKQK